VLNNVEIMAHLAVGTKVARDSAERLYFSILNKRILIGADMVTVRMVEEALEREPRTMARQQLLKQLRRLTKGEESSDERPSGKSRSSVPVMPAM